MIPAEKHIKAMELVKKVDIYNATCIGLHTVVNGKSYVINKS